MQINSTGPIDAKIMFIGDAPSLEDIKSGKLFSGSTLDNLLSQASIARYQCSFTNVAQDCPPAGKISYFFEDTKCTIPKPKMQNWINSLKKEIKLLKPNIIVTLGPTAFYILTGEKKLADFRGYILESSLVPGLKVLPTYHPKEINFDWKLYFQAVLDLRKAVRHSNNPALPVSTQTYIPGATYQQFISYMENLITHPEWEYLSIDVETVQPGSHIEELGLSHDPSFGISFFLLKNRSPTLPENDELLLWQTFSRLISMKKIVMQNAAYDTGVLWYNNKILVQNLYMDTLIAAHICWPELPRDLGFLGSICLDVPPWKHGSAKNQDYNPADAANTLGIAKVLDIELDKQKSQHTFDFEMGMIPVSLMMQLQGISIDIKTKKALTKAWTARKAQMEKQLFTLLGRTINFNSPKQMQQLLYVDLGLPPQYKRRKSVQEKRTLTSDAATLRTLSRLVPDNPMFNLILAYKKADTLLNFLDVELSPEGKVHTSYNITGASSDDEEDTKKTKRSFGRWSSSKSIILPFGSGNLQNIPPNARKMYKAPKGWKIIEADYVQAEAVIVAYLTGNQKLKQMFKDSFGLAPSERGQYDLHKITAAEMFGIPLNQVTKTQRTAGKTIRHAKNYSAGPLVIANRLGIKLSEAKLLMELYDKADPSLHAWHERIQIELKRSRVLTNLLGRKHHFLDRWGDSLFRSAYAYIPQSTIGDLLNVSLRKVYDSLPILPFEMTILLQLHDAIYVRVEDENVDFVIRHLRKLMLHPLTYLGEEFTVDVDFKIKTSWAKGKEVDINWRN